PAADDDAAHPQVGRGARQRVVGVGQAVGQQPVGGLLQHRVGVRQPLADGGQVAVPGGQLGGGALDVGQQVGDHAAGPHRQLAPDQVHGLDPVGALVDGGDADVPVVLGDAGLLDVAHA